MGLLCPCWLWQLPRKYPHARKSWGCQGIPFEYLFRRDFPHLGVCSKQHSGTGWGHQPGSSFLGGRWPCDPAQGISDHQLPEMRDDHSQCPGAEPSSHSWGPLTPESQPKQCTQVPGLAQMETSHFSGTSLGEKGFSTSSLNPLGCNLWQNPSLHHLLLLPRRVWPHPSPPFLCVPRLGSCSQPVPPQPDSTGPAPFLLL